MRRLLAACLGMLIAAATLHAAQPLQYKWSDEWSSSISCGAFDLIENQSGTFHIFYFYANDGTLRDGRLHQQIDIEIYREGHPNNVLLGRMSNIQHVPFEDGNLTGVEITGVNIKVNVPGYGHLYFDAGHAYLDADFNVTLLRGANHDLLLGQTDALCAYFQ